MWIYLSLTNKDKYTFLHGKSFELWISNAPAYNLLV
jgi:hypothetical protein